MHVACTLVTVHAICRALVYKSDNFHKVTKDKSDKFNKVLSMELRSSFKEGYRSTIVEDAIEEKVNYELNFQTVCSQRIYIVIEVQHFKN